MKQEWLGVSIEDRAVKAAAEVAEVCNRYGLIIDNPQADDIEFSEAHNGTVKAGSVGRSYYGSVYVDFELVFES